MAAPNNYANANEFPEEPPQERGCAASIGNCMSSLGDWMCSFFSGNRKTVIKTPDGHMDLGMLLQSAHFGDIILLRTKTKLDSAISVSSYVASDVAQCTECACLIPEKTKYLGWDHAALIVKDPEISKHEHYLLEIDRWGFHAYELLERIRYHERQGDEMAILPINMEVQDNDKVYGQLVKPFLDYDHKISSSDNLRLKGGRERLANNQACVRQDQGVCKTGRHRVQALQRVQAQVPLLPPRKRQAEAARGQEFPEASA